ncbi:MAG: NADH-quinone oxidoreductase subunit K [Verrucomicrobiota bacterium]
MVLETAILIGLLFSVATFLILQKSFVRILFGFIILSNAANLFVLSMSGSPDGKDGPVVLSDQPMVDPLPQALVLTAIVIGFGVTAYLVILLYRIFLDHKTTNIDELYAEDLFNEAGAEQVNFEIEPANAREAKEGGS